MMSIRLRLTLLYTTLLALSLTGFSVLLYLTLAHSTRSFMEMTLASEMRNAIHFSPASGEATLVSETSGRSCNSKGTVMGHSTNLNQSMFPVSDDGTRQIQSGEAIYEITTIDNTSLLVYSRPQFIDGQITGIVQVARSVSEQEQALQSLQSALAVGSLLTLSLAVAGGWMLSGAALHPIDQLTRTATLISEDGSFNHRVEYHGVQDEVGRLAATFNRMLQSLETAYQKMAQSLEAQRAFIADASHELRTPLTTLRGNIALLQRDPPITLEDRWAVLADIVEENERMIRLVSDLLTLARADYAPEVKLDSVLLPSLVAEIQRQAAGYDRSTVFCIGYVPNVEVLAKRDMLKQVLLILLDNAFKFTPAHGEIEISAEQRESSICLSVRDTGIGIAHDKLPHIFQRFYRADPSRNGTGYGLGLAIARALVERQHGQIMVRSEVGKGSVFTVMLPVQDCKMNKFRCVPANVVNFANAISLES
jgi:two-component system, OmpR family, sensor kinase